MADWTKLDTNWLTPMPSGSIVGLPRSVMPTSTPSTTAPSIYAQAPSTAIKPAPVAPTVAPATPAKPAATATPAAPAGAMTPEQITAYYASQQNAAMPLSPAQWLAQQGGTKPATPATPATPAPQTPAAPNANDIASKAGAAGLSVDEYQKLVTGNTVVTSAEQKQIATDLKIPEAETAAFAKPSKSTETVYNDAYASAGLADLHARILTLIETINAEKQQASDAVGSVNENPFLTEKSRVGRGQRVLNQSQDKIANETAMLSQLQGMYEQGVTEVNNLVVRTQNDFTQNQQSAQQYLNYLQTKAQQQAEGLKGDKTITAANSATKYLDGLTPKTIGSATTGFYRWDATTQSFVQVIKPAAPSSSTSPSNLRAEDALNMKNDIAAAIVDFQKQIQDKGWLGANPEAYADYRDQLIAMYGASAAIELDKAMATANISVDYGD